LVCFGLQVWHNYSFDRHVMEQLGITMRGFAGDTMHMARMWDSSRQMRGGYSLEALSSELALLLGAFRVLGAASHSTCRHLCGLLRHGCTKQSGVVQTGATFML
jgi:DNA polymerase-1